MSLPTIKYVKELYPNNINLKMPTDPRIMKIKENEEYCMYIMYGTIKGSFTGDYWVHMISINKKTTEMEFICTVNITWREKIGGKNIQILIIQNKIHFVFSIFPLNYMINKTDYTISDMLSKKCSTIPMTYTNFKDDKIDKLYLFVDDGLDKNINFRLNAPIISYDKNNYIMVCHC
jgi:hypothetical protein